MFVLSCLTFTVAASGSVSEGAATRHLVQRDNEHPAWSPDGTEIAYESGRGDRVPYQIHTINIDGRHQRKLTYFGNNFHPAWSPDSRKIAFSCSPGGGSRICEMNATGVRRSS
jgi:Tol biopolymer transport system component